MSVCYLILSSYINPLRFKADIVYWPFGSKITHDDNAKTQKKTSDADAIQFQYEQEVELDRKIKTGKDWQKLHGKSHNVIAEVKLPLHPKKKTDSKTHKTGSQTLTGILNRYALGHNLSVAIRKRLETHEAQYVKQWKHIIRPLPPGLSHYDMLTDHVRFDEQCVRHFLPNDTVFVSIIREPLDRFVSGFFYSRDVWQNQDLTRIPGPDPILTYLSDMPKWDTKFGTMTHSQMAFDFGLDLKPLQSEPDYLQISLRYLSRVFHLVLLTEAFDESIVLLKRTLSWKLQDMLYIRFNVGKTRKSYNFTQKQKDNFRKYRQEEYVLYKHFQSVFYKKIRAQDDTFSAEVEVFKGIRKKVESFCRKVMGSSGASTRELRVEGTKFSSRFRVTFTDCRFLFKETSSVKDVWFEKIMLRRLLGWSKKWKWAGEVRLH
ncbi:hypothetical protein ACOMHN_051345 [Nucella lapillus]